VDEVMGAPPDFADAYRMLNSVAIFPNIQDALPLTLGSFKTRIVEEGYRLLDQANPNDVFEQLLPPGPLLLDQRRVPEAVRRIREEGQERHDH
jgi:hypothetical protein